MRDFFVAPGENTRFGSSMDCEVVQKMEKHDGIVVSVLMLVYNHERWLAHAIESVMMQKTRFKFELVIAEDCSTDSSRDIVLRYKQKYPDKIRLLLNEVNLGMAKNARQIEIAATGKYVAGLEGDDYWTDPDKLQTQVDFLETHPEYSGCYHSVRVVDENDVPLDIGPSPYIYNEDSDYTKETWMQTPLPGQTGSSVIRNYFVTAEPEVLETCRQARCNGDNITPVLLLRYGKIRRIGKAMSCYRRTYTGDSWNARTYKKDMRAYWYINELERDRLAMKLWGLNFLPHHGARACLQSVIQEVQQKRTPSAKTLLCKMISYNLGQFWAFLFVMDIYRFLDNKPPFFVDSTFEDVVKKVCIGNYIIFGTGRNGEGCFSFFLRFGCVDRIVRVWDNDSNKHGSMCHGVTIGRPTFYELQGNVKILITSTKYEDEIKRQLHTMGYRENQILSFGGILRACFKYSIEQRWLWRVLK